MIIAKQFYLIRHGESEANKAGVAAGGGIDSPLTETGRQQALNLSPLLKSLPVKPSKIFHSPMKRATETAHLLNGILQLEITPWNGIEEHYIGDLEGKPWLEVAPYFEGEKDPPNGETMKDFEKRICTNINTILQQTLNGPPLIVAHGGLFHAFSRIYKRKFTAVPNCLIHHFDPYPDHEPFPWQIFTMAPNVDTLQKARSESCPFYK